MPLAWQRHLRAQGVGGYARAAERGVAFDPRDVQRRIEALWGSPARFGLERGAVDVYLSEIVRDRYALARGLALLRDELQFAGGREASTSIDARGADFSLPSVVTTVAHTNCGDRIHQGEAMTTYRQIVAQRFATLSEIGDLKLESFSPTGGGTDDGATLAHVTVGHQLDETLRQRVYQGNPRSCVLVGIDLMTHVGRMDEGDQVVFGRAAESPWREPRPACGAIVGAIGAYNPENGVHRRIRRDLGEDNFAHLLKNRVLTREGIDVTAVVAAAIVAIQGMRNVLEALSRELDERGVAHVTSSLTVNRAGRPDTVVYLGRGTAFGGELRVQGLGAKAKLYGGRLVPREADRRLELEYDGSDGSRRPSKTTGYQVRPSGAHPHAHAAAKLHESGDALPPMGQTLGIDKPAGLSTLGVTRPELRPAPKKPPSPPKKGHSF